MNLITMEHLTKSLHAERLLFDDTSFSINEGGEDRSDRNQRHRQIHAASWPLAGLEEPDGGTVIRGRNLTAPIICRRTRTDPEDTVLT